MEKKISAGMANVKLANSQVNKIKPGMFANQCFGSGIRCFFTPWIQIRDEFFFPDPGSF
jgi:hypothetical protein